MRRRAVPGVFRAFHTKGGSQTIGLELLAELAHKMEDLLDMIRKGEHIVDGHAISLILEAIDLMEQEIAAYVAHDNMDELAQHQFDLLALVKMAKEHNQEALDFKRSKNLADGPACFIELEEVAQTAVTEAYADGHVFLVWAKGGPVGMHASGAAVYAVKQAARTWSEPVLPSRPVSAGASL